jgi:vacuolar protein sorting-associated protein 13A/C
VHDIFYEPYQGFVLHGNKDLASGIARVSLFFLCLSQNEGSLGLILQGATSFVKKTVFGVTDSISKVTGSIGKGKRFLPFPIRETRP